MLNTVRHQQTRYWLAGVLAVLSLITPLAGAASAMPSTAPIQAPEVLLAQASPGMESWRPGNSTTSPPAAASPSPVPLPLPQPAAVPATPGEACGKRVFLAMEACIKRECEKDIYKNQRACQIRNRADSKATEGS